MTGEQAKRKLAAILSADVKGYSRLMEDDEEATVRTLTAYRELMVNQIQNQNGRVVDAKGDNILAEFPSVVDAVRCAVEIQKELSVRNADLPEHRRMEFRIGINLGDVIQEEDTIYGDGVNVAARIESLADAGGVCISRTAFDQVKNKLDLGYQYLGEHTVKNITEPVRVYKVLMEPEYAGKVLGEERPGPSKWPRAAIGAAVVLLIVAGALAIWNSYFRPSPMEPASVEKMAYPLPDKPSIAVLPFTNISGDPEQEYFTDGMTDTLITDLSKISGLFVIARNSVFTYKGKPVKVAQIGRELGVRYIMEGSVQRADNQVRINAQLIDTTTGGHLWAERYDGKMDNIFALQDKITGKIVTALAVKLTASEQEHIARKESYNVAAYDAYLQGLEHLGRHTPEDLTKALSYFEKTIKLDPNYHPTYSALALTYKIGAEWAWDRQSLGIQWGALAFVRMREYLEMALKRPTAVGHQIASEMHLRHRKFEEAIAEAERAIALDPNSSAGHWAMAYALIFSGRPDEAIDFIKRASRLDPRSPGIYLMLLGVAHFCMGQLEEAINLIERGLKHDPAIHIYESFLAASYAHLDSDQEAQAALNKKNMGLWCYWLYDARITKGDVRLAL